ncbi:Protein phosphatase 2C 1, partial [Ascosphaera aggregata]
LWDVCTDQEAVDHIRNITDAQAAAQALVDLSLLQFSSDNLSCMVVRFDKAKMRAVLGHAVTPAGLAEITPSQQGGATRPTSTVEANVAEPEGSGESAHPPASATAAAGAAADVGEKKE